MPKITVTGPLPEITAAASRERDLLARIAELETTLANERGDGAPDGWYWADGQWNMETDDGLYVADRNPCPTREDEDAATCPWLPTTWTAICSPWDDDEHKHTVTIGTYDTAREAMRAASERVRGGP